MPIIDYNLESAYSDPTNYGAIGGYNSTNKEFLWKVLRHDEFLPRLDIKPNDTILMVGVGFGWIAENWIAQGLGPICAIDTSHWIHSAKSQHANIDIYNFDITDYSTHDQIKQILGLQSSDKIDWCITEDFFTEITNQECIDISLALRSIGNNVIHYITPKLSEELLSIPQIGVRNYKTEEEWNTLLSPDRIVIR